MFDCQRAAQELAQRRLRGIQGDRLPKNLRPTTLEEAFAVQSRVREVLEASGEAVKGWKCLMPPEGKWVVAPIFESGFYCSEPDVCAVRPFKEQAGIEPEIGFVFERGLPPQSDLYTKQEVLNALGSMHLAFELMRGQYASPQECEFPELLADGLFNQGIYLGPQIPQMPPADIAITLTVAGNIEHIQGRHPGGDAFAPVVWLANFLSEQGLGIEAGQVVITGSYAGVLNVPFDQPVTVEYQGLGSIKTQFTQK